MLPLCLVLCLSREPDLPAHAAPALGAMVGGCLAASRCLPLGHSNLSGWGRRGVVVVVVEVVVVKLWLRRCRGRRWWRRCLINW
ncbi:unnamed protein product [Arctogadus glacialis]